jgi:hypothetical protein
VCPSVSAADFPWIFPGNHRDVSPLDTRYNCIAYAAGQRRRKWWPDSRNIGYWPPGVPREETIAAFVQAYGTLGYVACADGELEEGFEKIAIYASTANKPTHAAVQLLDGKWSSKLGDYEDIEHNTPEVVAGPLYGRVVCFLKRPRPTNLAPPP